VSVITQSIDDINPTHALLTSFHLRRQVNLYQNFKQYDRRNLGIIELERLQSVLDIAFNGIHLLEEEVESLLEAYLAPQSTPKERYMDYKEFVNDVENQQRVPDR
jgi:Ca2+-binding EF-hand superfamily protein